MDRDFAVKIIEIRCSDRTLIGNGDNIFLTVGSDKGKQVGTPNHPLDKFRINFNEMIPVHMTSADLEDPHIKVEAWVRKGVMRKQNVGSCHLRVTSSAMETWASLDAIVVRLAIISKHLMSSPPWLKIVQGEEVGCDDYGCVVPGSVFPEYAVQHDLNDHIADKTSIALKDFFAHPSPDKRKLPEIAWLGLPMEDRKEIYSGFGRKYQKQQVASGKTYRPISCPAPVTAETMQIISQQMDLLFGVGHRTSISEGEQGVKRVLGVRSWLFDAESDAKLDSRKFKGDDQVNAFTNLVMQIFLIAPDDTIAAFLLAKILSLCFEITLPVRPSIVHAAIMKECLTDMTVFEGLMWANLKDPMDILTRAGVPVGLIAAHWFSTVLVGALPSETWFRVMDVVLFDGKNALYAVVMAIFEIISEQVQSLLLTSGGTKEAIPMIFQKTSLMYDSHLLMHVAHNLMYSVDWAQRLTLSHDAHDTASRGTIFDRLRVEKVENVLSKGNFAGGLHAKAVLHARTHFDSGASIFLTLSAFSKFIAPILPECREALICQRVFKCFDLADEGSVDIRVLLCVLAVTCPDSWPDSFERILTRCFVSFDVTASGMLDYGSMLTLFGTLYRFACGHVNENAVAGLTKASVKKFSNSCLARSVSFTSVEGRSGNSQTSSAPSLLQTRPIPPTSPTFSSAEPISTSLDDTDSPLLITQTIEIMQPLPPAQAIPSVKSMPSFPSVKTLRGMAALPSFAHPKNPAHPPSQSPTISSTRSFSTLPTIPTRQRSRADSDSGFSDHEIVGNVNGKHPPVPPFSASRSSSSSLGISGKDGMGGKYTSANVTAIVCHMPLIRTILESSESLRPAS
jgi:hypothetical protein